MGTDDGGANTSVHNNNIITTKLVGRDCSVYRVGPAVVRADRIAWGRADSRHKKKQCGRGGWRHRHCCLAENTTNIGNRSAVREGGKHLWSGETGSGP